MKNCSLHRNLGLEDLEEMPTDSFTLPAGRAAAVSSWPCSTLSRNYGVMRHEEAGTNLSSSVARMSSPACFCALDSLVMTASLPGTVANVRKVCFGVDAAAARACL